MSRFDITSVQKHRTGKLLTPSATDGKAYHELEILMAEDDFVPVPLVPREPEISAARYIEFRRDVDQHEYLLRLIRRAIARRSA